MPSTATVHPYHLVSLQYFWLLHVLSRWEKFTAQVCARVCMLCFDAGLAAGHPLPSTTCPAPFCLINFPLVYAPDVQVAKEATPEAVAELFPFKSFFADAPQPLFAGRNYEEDMERARVGSSRRDGPGWHHLVRGAASVGPLILYGHALVSASAQFAQHHPLPNFQGCFRHLRNIFQELEEVRPFELLKTQGDRVSYLLTKQVQGCVCVCGGGGAPA